MMSTLLMGAVAVVCTCGRRALAAAELDRANERVYHVASREQVCLAQCLGALGLTGAGAC